MPFVAIPKLPLRSRNLSLCNDESDNKISLDKGSGQAIAVDHCSKNRNDEHGAKQKPKQTVKVVPAGPSPEKRGRDSSEKQSIQPADDIQDIESGDKASHEPNEGSAKSELVPGGKKRKSRTDHPPEDEQGDDTADNQETHQAGHNDTVMPTPSDNEPETDQAPLKKPDRKKRTDLPTSVIPLARGLTLTISPPKISTTTTSPPRAPKPTHSPITNSTLKYRVGLSNKARITSLLKIVRQ